MYAQHKLQSAILYCITVQSKILLNNKRWLCSMLTELLKSMDPPPGDDIGPVVSELRRLYGDRVQRDAYWLTATMTNGTATKRPCVRCRSVPSCEYPLRRGSDGPARDPGMVAMTPATQARLRRSADWSNNDEMAGIYIATQSTEQPRSPPSPPHGPPETPLLQHHQFTKRKDKIQWRLRGPVHYFPHMSNEILFSYKFI